MIVLTTIFMPMMIKSNYIVDKKQLHLINIYTCPSWTTYMIYECYYTKSTCHYYNNTKNRMFWITFFTSENVYNINSYFIITSHSYMVPTTKEILFSRTFPGRNYHFTGHSIQDLKVINPDMCEKAYNIYSMYDRVLTFLWYSLLNPSSCLIHPILFKF